MTSFRADIEGLRAVAILLVVAYHCGLPGFSGGYVGVDVFFVLSGYLITSLLVEELARTGSIDFVHFFARRARRLLPAVAVMLLACMALGMALYAPVEQDRLANTALATAAYASNLYFARASTDYLAAPSHTNPLLHTWSLSVEEQFYFVWPFLIVWLTRWSGRRAGNPAILWAGMGLLAAVSFASAVYLTATVQPWAFFLSPPRAWEFAVGGLGALGVRGLSRRGLVRLETIRSPWLAGALGWLGLFGILAAGTLYGETTLFPGTSALLPVIGTLLILVAGSGAGRSGVGRVLELGPCRAIGQLSYSWYLWHWPLLVFAGAVDSDLGLTKRVLIVLTSLLVAAVSYRWVEEPIRSRRWLALSSHRTLSAAVGVAVLCISGSVAWKLAAARWSETPSQAQFTRMKNDYPEIYRMGCDDYFHSAAVKECRFGSADAPRTAVLLGDSHAGHWFPALQRIFSSPGWQLVVITKSSCPIVEKAYFSKDLGRVYTECFDWVRASLARLEQMQPDVVLVSYASGYPFVADDLREGVASAVTSLSRSSRAVVLLRDVPNLGFDGPNCLARVGWRPAFLEGFATCETPVKPDRVDLFYSAQVAAAGGASNVVTIDLNSEVCPMGTCRVLWDGVVTYRDASHLSTVFAERLSGSLASRLREALPNWHFPGIDSPGGPHPTPSPSV